MKFVLFAHSLKSDWNHGNAHFLRGVCTELAARGHEVRVYEPENAWSAINLVRDRGPAALEDYRRVYPQLRSDHYSLEKLNLYEALTGADVVIVHEWNEPELVARLGRHRQNRGGYLLFFHDTHHRSVTAPHEMAAYDLSGYDGVLAFGEVIRRRYLENGWAKRAWTWHEAADHRVFKPPTPITERPAPSDLVWVGNWGDEERTAELHEFLLNPVRELGLKATVYGVRYPAHALRALEQAGITYGGSIANYDVPKLFAQHKVTVHVPRRPYVESLPGIPTIRPFEAMACGIPLVSAPWKDSENLFNPGEDFLIARNGEEMKAHLRWILDNPDAAQAMAHRARSTVLERHTCADRVDELMALVSPARLEGRASVA